MLNIDGISTKTITTMIIKHKNVGIGELINNRFLSFNGYACDDYQDNLILETIYNNILKHYNLEHIYKVFLHSGFCFKVENLLTGETFRLNSIDFNIDFK